MNIEVKHCRYGRMMYHPVDRYIGLALEQYGEYSQSEIQMWEQFMGSGFVALDIGANIGTHTLYLARKCTEGGLVYAVEPQPQIFNMMVGNVALNELTNVKAIWGACSDHCGETEMPQYNYMQGGNYGGISLRFPDHGQAVAYSHMPLIKVPLVTIDSFDIDREVHFIKIDVEGMEYETVMGGMDTIKRWQPVMYIEYNKDSTPEVLEKLFALGYRAFWHSAHMYNPNNYYKNCANFFGGTANNNMLLVPEKLSGWKIDADQIKSVLDTNPAFQFDGRAELDHPEPIVTEPIK